MSILIELDKYEQVQKDIKLSTILAEVFKDHQYHCSKTILGKSSHFFLRASHQTYRLSTHWEFKEFSNLMKIIIRFYTS